jgi:hypothetical protein
MNISPQSSGLKSEPSKKATKAGGKCQCLTHCTTLSPEDHIHFIVTATRNSKPKGLEFFLSTEIQISLMSA